MSGGGGGQQSTSTTSISPEFKPYIQSALSAAQSTYDATKGSVPSQLYVNPSDATNQALSMAQQRATAGSPLLQAAQQETLNTINGYGVNPFLSGALNAAYAPTVNAGQDMIRGLESKMSAAGRYGSDAATQAYARAMQGYGQSIGNSLNTLAYGSSEAERARQMQAVQNAPAMANADYNDIQKLLQVGQAQEGYQQAAINGQLAAIDAAYKPLQNAAQIFYGAPLESTTTQQATPTGGK